MIERILGLRQKWGDPTFPVEVPPERFDQFQDRVPDALLGYWREYGFSGFNDGMWWICDPVVWQPAVDVWTRHLNLAMGEDAWIAITRNAFGDMDLWGQRTGMSLSIIPYRGWVFPTDKSERMASPQSKDRQIYARFISLSKDSADVLGEDKKGLFDRVLAALGPISVDTMYGFVPVPALGGPMLPGHVEIFDAGVHMQLLSDLTPRRVMGDITKLPD
ncbi:MAG: DUF1851 domain-containing protein [Mycolicibacterium sp.]|nr:DUF1851 domain-containing protein [Mycolicibacterium sp.]